MKAPDVYIFNPTCDFAVAVESPAWQPNQILRKMETDLGTLPVFLANRGDYIIVNELPSENYLESLAAVEISGLHFIDGGTIKTNRDLIDLPKGRLLPWGWSPSVHRLLEPLKKSCSEEFRNSPVCNWEPGKKQLYSRKMAAGFLTSIVTTIPSEFLIQREDLPVICPSTDDVKNCLKKWGKIMIKAPWSSSGRGLQKITRTPVHEAIWQKTAGMIRNQGFVMVEPLLKKQFDLAFEFSIEKKRATFEGISLFLTDQKGQYLGNFLNGFPASVRPEVPDFVNRHMPGIIRALHDQIERSPLPAQYEGYLGFDAMVYTDDMQRLRINPCLEINLRYTMGIMAMKTGKLISDREKGMFCLYYRPGRNFSDFSHEMKIKYPPVIRNGRIFSGFFPLTEVKSTSQFGAYLLVD